MAKKYGSKGQCYHSIHMTVFNSHYYRTNVMMCDYFLLLVKSHTQLQSVLQYMLGMLLLAMTLYQDWSGSSHERCQAQQIDLPISLPSMSLPAHSQLETTLSPSSDTDHRTIYRNDPIVVQSHPLSIYVELFFSNIKSTWILCTLEFHLLDLLG